MQNKLDMLFQLFRAIRGPQPHNDGILLTQPVQP